MCWECFLWLSRTLFITFVPPFATGLPYITFKDIHFILSYFHGQTTQQLTEFNAPPHTAVLYVMLEALILVLFSFLFNFNLISLCRFDYQKKWTFCKHVKYNRERKIRCQDESNIVKVDIQKTGSRKNYRDNLGAKKDGIVPSATFAFGDVSKKQWKFVLFVVFRRMYFLFPKTLSNLTTGLANCCR